MSLVLGVLRPRHAGISAQANVSEAKVKPRSGGRSQNLQRSVAKLQGYLA
jgi:hypothetical protein